jgi:hypothetical protein
VRQVTQFPGARFPRLEAVVEFFDCRPFYRTDFVGGLVVGSRAGIDIVQFAVVDGVVDHLRWQVLMGGSRIPPPAYRRV